MVSIDKHSSASFLAARLAISTGLIALLWSPVVAAADHPNVLLLAVDDMNDWVGFLGGSPTAVHTPNLDALAARGVAFTNAHCASPVCCPSRVAIMTGRLPSSTGIYNNGQWWKPHLPDLVTIPVHFRRHGYVAVGSGKIFHHTAGNNPPYQWNAYHRLVFEDDPWFRGSKLNYPWSTSAPYPEEYPFSGVEGLGHENDWGSLDMAESDHDDARTVDYAIEYLHSEHTRPFLLACGTFRPHLPWYVPRKYFDLYPLDQIELPTVRADDLDDIPAEGRALSEYRRSDFETIKGVGRWKQAIQAYLASISFADAQVGRLLSALDASGLADQTIVVLWSDHGWHLGEKNHWHKMTLWEEATRVPLIIVAPGVAAAGGKCASPASLIDLYPTLNELCGLPAVGGLDGESLVPLLRDPNTQRSKPAVTEYGRGQCAVRSQDYRYIRYSDGSEELYDHRVDPNEWTNLADNPASQQIKARLAEFATRHWAESARSKKAYQFHPDTYSWTVKQTGEVVKGE